MPKRVPKNSQPLEGVKCVVNTCEYYSSGDHCLASSIEVQPRNARDSQDTDCATFTPKDQY